MSEEVFPVELVDEIALYRDALHFAVSWLGWRKWLRANGLLEWCSTGVLVPSGCGSFAPFWQYESDWVTYLSRLRLDRRRVTDESSPYTVLGGEEEFSREDEERIARLVMRRQSLELIEREWCRNNSHALRRVRPALLVFSSSKSGSRLPQPLLYSEYARLSLNETRWYAEQSDLVDFVGRLVRTLVDRFGRIGKETVLAADPVVDAFLDRVTSTTLWRHKLDETLNSFDDETLDLLLRVLASCRTHLVKDVTVYTRQRSALCAQSDTRLVDASSPQKSLHLGNWPVLSFLLVDISFMRVSRETILKDTLHLFMGRFQQSLDSLMRTSGDWLTTIPVPDSERDAIYVVRSDDEKNLATSLSHVVVARSDLRCLLNFTFLPNERAVLYGGPLATETAALSAVFSASESRAAVQRVARSEETEPDDAVCCDLREVLLRALQLRSVALYFLRYSSTSETPVTKDEKLCVFLQRSGLGPERYFIDNGIERGTALTDAILSFAAQMGLTRNVNLLRLQDVRAYASYDQVRIDDENRKKEQESFDTLLVATSALLSTDGVEHFTRAASQQLRDAWPRTARYGMFFRHERYSDLQLLLLPTECSPVFDRVIELPGLPDENRETEQQPCNGYLRLCLFKLRDQDDNFSERGLTNPAVMASLLREVVAHITTNRGVSSSTASYSPLILFAQKNDDTAVRSSTVRPSLQNLFDRDKIAAMVRIDPFLSIAPCRAAEDDVSTQCVAPLVESLPRFFFPNCKLWRALDTLPIKCAFVKTTPVTYCPHMLFECGISLTQRGLIPLEATNANDTWKLYVMDNVRSKKPPTCDRCYSGPISEDTPIFYREDRSERNEVKEAQTSASTADAPTVSSSTPTSPLCSKKDVKTVVRQVDGQVSISSVIPYFAVKNAHGQDWLLYETGGIDKFDSIVAALGLERVLTTAPVVRLINWDEHFSPDDTNRPRLEKLSAKRVYMINGLIGFCEQQTKFVSRSKLPKPSKPVSVVNFANALIRPGDSLCFYNTVDRVDPTIRIAPMHFYHRVYENMVRNERHPIVGDGGYVDLRFRETADYFVLVFQCTRIWFPRVELLQRLVEIETTCFGETPRQLVPLVDFYARQALRKR